MGNIISKIFRKPTVDDIIYKSSDGKIVIKFLKSTLAGIRVYMNDKLFRISLNQPEYIGGFEYLNTFTDEEKQLFVNEITKPYKKGIVWDYIVTKWGDIFWYNMGNMDLETHVYAEECPDYNLLSDGYYLIERNDIDNPELNEGGEVRLATNRESGSFIVCPSECTIPSIKVFNKFIGGYHYVSNVKMCRISLLEPKYIYGVGSDWVLSDDEKIELMRVLNETITTWDGKVMTTWEAILNEHNNDIAEMIYQNFVPEDLPIPDYTKLR